VRQIERKSDAGSGKRTNRRLPPRLAGQKFSSFRRFFRQPMLVTATNFGRNSSKCPGISGSVNCDRDDFGILGDKKAKGPRASPALSLDRLKIAPDGFQLDSQQPIKMDFFKREMFFEVFPAGRIEFHKHLPLLHVDEHPARRHRPGALQSPCQFVRALSREAGQRVLRDVPWHLLSYFNAEFINIESCRSKKKQMARPAQGSQCRRSCPTVQVTDIEKPHRAILSVKGGNLTIECMKRYRAATIFAAILLFAMFAFASRAQDSGGMGTLAGVVLSQGKPVAGASVIMQTANGDGPRATKTNSQGRFFFPELIHGYYDVRAADKGRVSDWKHNVEVNVGKQTEVKLQLSSAQKKS